MFLSPDSRDNNVVVNFKLILEVIKKAGEAVASPKAVSGCVSMTSENLVCAIGGRQPNPPSRQITGRL